MREMAKYPSEFDQALVHTGQHYDSNMSKVFMEELELPPPDYYLGVGSGSHAAQTARIMVAFEQVLLQRRPDWVFVVGDVNSTLACALTSAKLQISVAHVEAGLRSFDRTMPEEYNRLLTDHISDILFTHSCDANENLMREGIEPDRIHFVGNVMIDTLVRLLPRAETLWNRVLSNQYPFEDATGFVLVTLHRPSNVDDRDVLPELIAGLRGAAQLMPVIFPVHPRTRRRLTEWGLDGNISSDYPLRLIDPLPYLDFLALERHASLVVTDSGGIQEETTYLGVPCLTVRHNTERPVTIHQGTNRLVSSEANALLEAIQETLEQQHEQRPTHQPPELWDGNSAKRIVAAVREKKSF